MGERGAIPADVLAAMRDSGLAHLLAISGLHVGLVAGILFFAARGGCALVPAVALRFPIKKWAAVVALIGAFGYLLLAGAPVPTQRAFVMVGLVLVAVLVDRRGISMRLVVWAAMFILLVRPESLLGASFQLSFAAVLALVAGYEALGPRLRVWYGESGAARRVLLYVGGVALTTVIAGLATAPFALFHFNRVVVYSLAANLVAVPLTALWVMPWLTRLRNSTPRLCMKVSCSCQASRSGQVMAMWLRPGRSDWRVGAGSESASLVAVSGRPKSGPTVQDPQSANSAGPSSTDFRAAPVS